MYLACGQQAKNVPQLSTDRPNPWNRGSPVAVGKVTGQTSDGSRLDSQHGSETFLSCILSKPAIGSECRPLEN